jgi:hypothetical protein
MTQLREALVRAAHKLNELEELVIQVEGDHLDEANAWLGIEKLGELDDTCQEMLKVNPKVWSVLIRDVKWMKIHSELKEGEQDTFLNSLQFESQWPALTEHYEQFDERDCVDDT